MANDDSGINILNFDKELRVNYRKIEKSDNAIIAKIIRDNLEKFSLNIPGTAYFDPQLDTLSEFYNEKPEMRVYFVVLDDNDNVVGGAGAAEFEGLENTAELQKLYLSDSVKGKGYGKELLRIVENWARESGYKKLYLETHTNLSVALKLYEKAGFKQIDKPKNVAHATMNRFYLKEL